MNRLKFVTLICVVLVVVIGILKFRDYEQPYQDVLKEKIKKSDPPCLQMYFYIEKYAEEYNIPKSYAYGVAYYETRYTGPFHWNYDHKITSSGGALGPMQIMMSTAKLINHETISTEKLKNDIEYNIRTSMKLIRKLKNTYKDWKVVFGAYNTGKPVINDYAIKIVNFQPIW